VKAFFAPLIIVGAVILTGCESAQIPMGDADEIDIDEHLIGEWWHWMTMETKQLH
jgi:hypothetical protein